MKEAALTIAAYLGGAVAALALWVTGIAAVEVHRAIRAERAKHRAKRARARKARPGKNYTQAWPKPRPREGAE